MATEPIRTDGEWCLRGGAAAVKKVIDKTRVSAQESLALLSRLKLYKSLNSCDFSPTVT
jgi:hypothetical protein